MIYWAQLFHFYQPPTQLPMVLKKICDESYKPLINVFRRFPHARATINISGVLLELLDDYGQKEVINGLRELGEKGQVEFTGSGKYHPILPLIPRDEVKRQIELNLATLRSFLAKEYVPKGFFPPEMCYSDEIVPEIIASGHRWTILGGVACPVAWPLDRVHQIEHNGQRLAVLFRDDILSNKISFQQIGANGFLEHLKQNNAVRENKYIVTAMDAETYGHHIQDWEKLFLAAVYEQLRPTRKTYAGIKQVKKLAAQQSTFLADIEFIKQVKTVTISELIDAFPPGEIITPKPSSWSTSAEDMAAGNFYPLWLDQGNEIHRLQWEHLRLCIEMVYKAQECASNSDECGFYGRIARGLLDMAEHSCQFWWASRRPMWDMNLIHLGLIDQWRALVNAYRAINKSNADERTKADYYYKSVAARDIRNKIVDRFFIL